MKGLHHNFNIKVGVHLKSCDIFTQNNDTFKPLSFLPHSNDIQGRSTEKSKHFCPTFEVVLFLTSLTSLDCISHILSWVILSSDEETIVEQVSYHISMIPPVKTRKVGNDV